MKLRILFQQLFLILLLTSCELPTLLTIKASGKPGVSVTIYADKGLVSRSVEPSNEKIVLTVPTKGTKVINDTSIDFGIGGWQEHRFDFATGKIDSIIIVNSSTTIRVTNKPAIKDFLKKHFIKGWNEKVLIEAE